MKIAMIGHKRIPSREGGVEIVVEELATRLVKRGHNVTVYNRKGNNVLDKKIKTKRLNEYKGVKIRNVFTINKKGLDATIYSFLATIKVILGNYDIIHYHAEGSCAMLWLPKIFHKKIIVTIHGLDWQRAKWGGFATKYIKFGEKMAAQYADEIIVLSKGIQKYFKDEYNRDTIVLPNGIERPQNLKPDIINKKYNLEKDKYILFLARIVPEKGLHYLLNAFKKIDTEKKLVIAGGASHTNEYFEEIKKMANKDSRVIMTGFVQGQELQELFSNCYLYCLPSDIEGMPISLLEALSYGKRCLVSDIEENVQVSKKYLDTFKKSNVEDLKNKLQQLLENSNKYNEREIQEYILQKYNWDDIVEKTEKIYLKNIGEEKK